MGTKKYPDDYDGLHREVARILHTYEGKALKDINLQNVMSDLLGLSFKHQLQVPSNVWRLVKTMIMLESLGSRLDPNFDVFEVSRPYADRLRREMMQPKSWGPIFFREIMQWLELLRKLPSSGRQLIDKLEQGELQISIDIRRMEHLLFRLDRIANRLAISVLMASLIVGLALMNPTLGGEWMQLVFTVAFAIVSLLGLWLLIAMLWSGR